MTGLKLSVHGASHAEAIRFRLAGFPTDFPIDRAALAAFMARRAPGRDELSTQRKEPDEVELHAREVDECYGARKESVLEGVIRNTDMRPGDYGRARTVPRPGHADFGQWVEMGRIPTGGGKNSGRLTAALCAAGGVCKQWLESRGIAVEAEIASIGKVTDPEKFEREILAAKSDLDSVGGTICCRVTGVKPGLGGPLFDGLEGAISQAVFAIPGVKGIAFGNGFDAAALRGSENNDAFIVEDGSVRTATNRHGGILGGRTTGMPIEFTVAMKPTPTIYREQKSVDLATMTPTVLAMKGRHDPCIVRRAVPAVEAMAAYVLTDALMKDDAAHPRICLTLTGKTLEGDLAQFASQRYFTDMVEVRLDLLEEGERDQMADFLPRFGVPVIVTFRRACDGGAFKGKEGERKSFFKEFFQRLISPRASGDARPYPLPSVNNQAQGTKHQAPTTLYVDFEDDFRDEKLAQLAKRAGARVIRSLHDFNGKPGDVAELCRRLRGDTDEIPKVAFMPKDLEEVYKTFEETQCFRGIPHVICAMGPMGLATRVLASRIGSAWTYASVAGLEGIGHVTPHELVRTYRFRQLTPETMLYGVTGWPLKATRSPEINNAAWGDEDEDKVMIPYPSKDAHEAFAFMYEMDMRGLAVTIPHKQEMMQYGEVDAAARKIGAVNTMVLDEKDAYVGYNTDAEGFGAAIRRFVGREDFGGLHVAVLGAGGASKAVCFALKRLGATVKVYHRKTPKRVCDLIVNATPVDPIPDYCFAGSEMVYDLVYVPAETPLMARARAAGCRVENGFSMLTAQAAAQRKLWRCG